MPQGATMVYAAPPTQQIQVHHGADGTVTYTTTGTAPPIAAPTGAPQVMVSPSGQILHVVGTSMQASPQFFPAGQAVIVQQTPPPSSGIPMPHQQIVHQVIQSQPQQQAQSIPHHMQQQQHQHQQHSNQQQQRGNGPNNNNNNHNNNNGRQRYDRRNNNAPSPPTMGRSLNQHSPPASQTAAPKIWPGHLASPPAPTSAPSWSAPVVTRGKFLLSLLTFSVLY
jgi:hypothetical protein